ncbi:MAG: divergent polysaccharide deacetylase family protein [Thermodesulfobacteriota bacterium]
MAQRKGKSQKKRKQVKLNFSPVLLAAILLGVFILGAAAFFIIDRFTDAPGAPEKIAIVKEIPKPVPPIKPPVFPPPIIPAYKYRAAIVIDDMGRDISKLRDLMEVDVPINIAILPYLKDSVLVAEEANARGWNVILHLPMEPRDIEKHNPGKGALLTGMTTEEVRIVVNGDLDAVPFAVGMNNHMGSRFTEDKLLMGVVLETAKERGVFFLDSKTTNKSVGQSLARKMGVKSAARSVFLDNSQDKEYISAQIEELIRLAKKNGTAIGIGHPHLETISVIRERALDFERAGVRLVSLEELVK